MAGILGFIEQQRARQEREDLRETQRQAIARASGRAPGVGPFLPGEGGSGLLADPLDPQRQAAFAAQVASEAPAIGAQLLQGIFANQAGLEQTGITQAGATERAEMAADVTQSEGAAGRESRESIANMQGQISRLNTLDIIEGRRADAIAAREAALAAAGTATVVSPFSAQPMQVPRPGTVQYKKEQGAVDSLESMLASVNAQIQDIDTFGSENVFGNDEVVGRMRSRLPGLLFRATQAREGGAPQAAELELNAQSLPDPTTFMSNLRGVIPGRGERERWISQYRTFGREISRSLLAQARRNPALNIDYGMLDPEILSPESRAFLEANPVVAPAVLRQLGGEGGAEQ